jgi:glycosyltransferase involved in cell wall biosynthesis
VMRVDVIVPCHGYGRFLRSCVSSVLDQEGVDVRVLILNDASPDETSSVAEALASEDGRVAVRHHAQNRGHISTYNEGLEWATAPFSLLLDADDLLVQGALARAARLLTEHPEVAMCYGRARIAQGGTVNAELLSPAGAPGDPRWWIVPGSRFIEASCDAGRNAVLQPTAVVRTAIQRAAGGYRPELPHSGDLEMWLRLAARGDVALIDAPQAVYRVHSANMTRGYLGAADVRQRSACFACFFTENRHRVPNEHRLRRRASSALAELALRTALREWRVGNRQEAWSMFRLAMPHLPQVVARLAASGWRAGRAGLKERRFPPDVIDGFEEVFF